MSRTFHVVFWLILIALVVIALTVLSDILLPFVVGLAVAYFLDPAADYLERLGFSRVWAVVTITSLFVALCILAASLILPVLLEQAQRFIDFLPALSVSIREWATPALARLSDAIGLSGGDRMGKTIQGESARIGQLLRNLLGGIIRGGSALVGLISVVAITPVVTFYLLLDWDRMVAQIDSWLPRHKASVIREQMREIDRTLAGFARGQATVCLILAGYYGVGLSLAGLSFGLLIGMAAGMISFIPYVGSVVGGVSSIGLAALTFTENWRIAMVVGIFLIGQLVEGNVLTPRLVGGRVGLHPIWVIFALLSGAALFGFKGILIAVPVAAVCGVLCRFALRQYLESPLHTGGSVQPQIVETEAGEAEAAEAAGAARAAGAAEAAGEETGAA